MTQTDTKVKPILVDGELTEEQRKASLEVLDAAVKAEPKPM